MLLHLSLHLCLQFFPQVFYAPADGLLAPLLPGTAPYEAVQDRQGLHKNSPLYFLSPHHSRSICHQVSGRGCGGHLSGKVCGSPVSGRGVVVL